MKRIFKKIWTSFSFPSLYKEGESGLIIPYQQLNWVIALLLGFGITSFVAGYFWGQKKAVDYFIRRIEDDSFADRISYALYTMNDRDITEFEEPDVSEAEKLEGDDDLNQQDINGNSEVQNDENQDTGDVSDSDDDIPLVSQSDLEQQSSLSEVEIIQPVESKKEIIEKRVYLAPLAGFGTLQAAKNFLQRVKIIDENASIAEKISTTRKGRKITWYQVMSGEYADKNALDRLIRYCEAKEHIKDIKIIERKAR